MCSSDLHELGDDAIEVLRTSPTFARLRSLILKGCGVGKEQAKALRDRFGVGVCTFGA